MTEQEIAELKKENIRQQQIIDELLAFNMLLRNKVAQLEKDYLTQKPVDSIPGTENATTQPVDSILRSENGITQVFDSIYHKENATPQLVDSIQRAEDGIIQPVNSMPGEENHGKQLNTGLPTKITASEGNVSMITQRIKQQKLMPLSKQNGKKLAKLLIHLHNKGESTSSGMCKATGYSKGGLAKTLMNLRRKKWAIRQGVRNYQLTAIAHGLLHGLNA